MAEIWLKSLSVDMASKFLKFESFTLDLARLRVHGPSGHVPLRRKSFDVLRYLLDHRGRVVTKGELLEAIWPDAIVTEDSLTQCISEIRRALVDDRQRIIKTVPRRGYLVDTPISVSEDAATTTKAVPEVGVGVKPLWQALPLPDRPSIAVLAFTNLGSDPEADYLADGIVEDIITELSRFSELMVIARNSSFKYKGKSVDVRRVGRELGVGYVLEGSIRRSGELVRISAQLIDAQTGAHRWAERYDHELSDIFAMQAEVARTIACILVAHLNKAEAQHTLLKPPSTWQAHDYYLRAVANFTFLFRPSLEKLYETRQLLERSLAVDPNYARALAVLSNTYVIAWLQKMDCDFLQPATLDRAYELARRAVQSDASLPQAHAQLGWVLSFRGEHDAAIEAFGRAAALNPNFTSYHFGAVLILAGKFDRAEQSLKAHLRLDPFYLPMAAAYVGLLHYMRKRYVDAVGPLREAVSRMPNFRAPHTWLAATYGQLGYEVEARAQAAEVLRIEPTFTIDRTSKPTMRFKYPEHAEHFYEGIRKAGLPEK